MRKNRNHAFSLRKDGRSYREITELTGVPKSTLFEWFHTLEWSRKIKEGLVSRNKKQGAQNLAKYRRSERIKFLQLRKGAIKEAGIQYQQLRNNPLFIAGIMLYWGEGDKSSHYGHVRLSNTDINLLKIFSRFLSDVCKIPEEKLKVWVLLYPDLNRDSCLTFWQRGLRIPRSQFIKPTIIQGRHPTKRVTNGVCTVYIYDRFFKIKLLEWINQAGKQL